MFIKYLKYHLVQQYSRHCVGVLFKCIVRNLNIQAIYGTNIYGIKLNFGIGRVYWILLFKKIGLGTIQSALLNASYCLFIVSNEWICSNFNLLERLIKVEWNHYIKNFVYQNQTVICNFVRYGVLFPVLHKEKEITKIDLLNPYYVFSTVLVFNLY